jgi:hypothetical protein
MLVYYCGYDVLMIDDDDFCGGLWLVIRLTRPFKKFKNELVLQNVVAFTTTTVK